VNFYATTHVGAQSSLADEIPRFNQYLEKVSSYMTKGNTYSDIAVYLPTEDVWSAGKMPAEKQFKWAWGYYEMRYVYFPDELDGYCPTWINKEFLHKATVDNGVMEAGGARYKALYIDVEFLDYKTLDRVVQLAGKGLRIILKRDPAEPGTIRHEDYPSLIRQLQNMDNISIDLPSELNPFIRGADIPRHWCRMDGETLYVFFPNPKSDHLKFPLEYGQSLESESREMDLALDWLGKNVDLCLVFRPYQSLLYKIEYGKAEPIDIEFIPVNPSVRDRPDGYKGPWLVDPKTD
jgi:hypothetical protein